MNSYIVLAEVKSDAHIMEIFVGGEDEEDAISKICRHGMSWHHEIIGCSRDYETELRNKRGDRNRAIFIIMLVLAITGMILHEIIY